MKQISEMSMNELEEFYRSTDKITGITTEEFVELYNKIGAGDIEILMDYDDIRRLAIAQLRGEGIPYEEDIYNNPEVRLAIGNFKNDECFMLLTDGVSKSDLSDFIGDDIDLKDVYIYAEFTTAE